MTSLAYLPGGDLITQGLEDSAVGSITPAACLISIGWPRLNRAGMDLDSRNLTRIAAPEHRLYQLLATEPGDAYSRYNSLIRQLISFEQALDGEMLKGEMLKN